MRINQLQQIQYPDYTRSVSTKSSAIENTKPVSPTKAVDVFDLQPSKYATYDKDFARSLTSVTKSESSSNLRPLQDFPLYDTPKESSVNADNAAAKINESTALSKSADTNDYSNISDEQMDRFLKKAFKLFDLGE